VLEGSTTEVSVVVSGVGAALRSVLGATPVRVPAGSVLEGSTTEVSVVVSGVGAALRSVLGAPRSDLCSERRR
jgi:hypothetical protein